MTNLEYLPIADLFILAGKSVGSGEGDIRPVNELIRRYRAIEAERNEWSKRALASEEEAEKVLERANDLAEKHRALEAAARLVLAFADYAANSFDRCATPERQALRVLLSKEHHHG